MRRFVIVLIMCLFVIFLFTSQSNKIIRSPVDLRDSTNTTPSVIIVECDCVCDSIPVYIPRDSVPII